MPFSVFLLTLCVCVCVRVCARVCVCVCSQAVRYLQKVGYYKESGFSERNIHKAYEKAGKDWDRALDILTQQNR